MSTSTLSSTVVKDLCKRYSNQEIELLSYSIKNLNESPTGFLGQHEVLSVIIQTKDQSDPQELIFFMKTAPTHIASRQKYIEEFNVYKKEVSVYRNLLPKLQEGQPDISAQCYYAKDVVLVFEHLGEMEFQMAADRSGLLDYNHLECALSSLASLHASSIIFEATSQEKISEMFPEIIKENTYPSAEVNSARRDIVNNVVGALCEIIKIIPEFRQSNRLEYILKQFPQEMNRIFDLVKPTKTKYLNVFSHGDLWANNLLFKYEQDGRPVQCRFVDFQLTRYAPPIFDVITLLTISTTKEFRLQHLDSLLTSYYSMLEYFLRIHGLEINDFLPPKQFEESINELKIVGLIQSCLISHITMFPAELTKKILSDESFQQDFFKNKRKEICIMTFNSDAVYRSRLSDMISDFVNSYILN
ncbi:uncharacterized protein LOC129914100 [Episyrphus balteatus]|uniref:uncharacterized protein LOC129914100 n=1 Tax=Episyrphus balteatus TaxID=286459 RepID=UPI0024863170|nr:uncharacterized protein LOC129914100 [Episyrphus balteatus]